MKELKTLKDFVRKQYSEGDDNKGNKIKFFDERELKAEAVKWVKEWLQYPLNEDGEWRLIRQPRVSDWMDFFNITEEDLK